MPKHKQKVTPTADDQPSKRVKVNESSNTNVAVNDVDFSINKKSSLTEQWKCLLSSTRINKLPSNSNLTKVTPQKDTEGQGVGRNQFLRDNDSILFSTAFRRMKDKTQVFPLPNNDSIHNRLLHSLECSSIGRSIGYIGREVGKFLVKKNAISAENATNIGDIVSAACLAHDIGNPPFGHAGEGAMRSWWIEYKKTILHKLAPHLQPFAQRTFDDFELFEGNASGFRLITSIQQMGLTAATLGAFTKYPVTASELKRNKERIPYKKNGLYETEIPIWKEVANACGLQKVDEDVECWSRHPLVYLVEAADDIAYHIMDAEDGVKLNLLDETEVKRSFAKIILRESNTIPSQDDDEINSASLKQLRGSAINSCIAFAVKQFEEQFEDIMSGIKIKPLADSILEPIEWTTKIYDSTAVAETLTPGFTVLHSLMNNFVDSALIHVLNDTSAATNTTNNDNDNDNDIINKTPKSTQYLEYINNPKYKHVFRLLPEEVRTSLHRIKSFHSKNNNITTNTNNIIGNCDSSLLTNNPVYLTILTIADYVSGMTDSYAISRYKIIAGKSS